MKKTFIIIGRKISRIVDFFYPPFRRYVSLQFFRYGVVGASNMVFDWVLFFTVYHYIFHQQMLDLGFMAFKSYNATLMIVFPITLLSGFLLQKYVTFTASELKGRVQLVRYISVVLANLLINYIGLKLLVEYAHFYATPSKMIVTIFTMIFSYFSQKIYTFKTSGTPVL